MLYGLILILAMNIPRLPLAAILLALASSGAFAQTPAPKLLISEDFESTPVGEIPKGFTKNGPVAVADDFAHSGKKSLRIEPIAKGARTITKTGPEIAALGGQFWGRLYFKVKLPTPLPVIPEGKTTAGIHTTFVSGKATSPLFNDRIETRMMGTSFSTAGTFSWLYNVQPSGGRKEFGVSTKTKYKYTDEWTLAEWSVDNTTQSYHFFINGQEVTEIAVSKGAGQFEGAELPATYENLTFGWLNYQAATEPGFTVWIDDLAISKERIGPVATAGAVTATKK
jgi:hypothetical protein